MLVAVMICSAAVGYKCMRFGIRTMGRLTCDTWVSLSHACGVMSMCDGSVGCIDHTKAACAVCCMRKCMHASCLWVGAHMPLRHSCTYTPCQQMPAYANVYGAITVKHAMMHHVIHAHVREVHHSHSDVIMHAGAKLMQESIVTW